MSQIHRQSKDYFKLHFSGSDERLWDQYVNRLFESASDAIQDGDYTSFRHLYEDWGVEYPFEKFVSEVQARQQQARQQARRQARQRSPSPKRRRVTQPRQRPVRHQRPRQQQPLPVRRQQQPSRLVRQSNEYFNQHFAGADKGLWQLYVDKLFESAQQALADGVYESFNHLYEDWGAEYPFEQFVTEHGP